MCDTPVSCQHPEKLKGQPGHCSPQQIKECHGSEDEHPCSPEATDETASDKE